MIATQSAAADSNYLSDIKKSIIIHKDNDAFGLRIKGQSPVFIEHVHENGAAWRAGVRALDLIDKVNGIPVSRMDHKDVVLAFKNCNRFVALTLICPERADQKQSQGIPQSISISCLPSIETHSITADSSNNSGGHTNTNYSLRIANTKLPQSSTNPDRHHVQPPLAFASFLSPPHTIGSLESATKRPPVINKRIEIIREFIDTERAHTERLRCLNDLFYRPLKQTGFISVEQLRTVFSCHRTLYKIHRQIYRILMSAHYDAYSEPLIGSALLEIFEGDLRRRLERASCTFCSAQATSSELLNKMTRRETKTGEFLAQVTSQRMVGRLGVKDLLASCFQRLTKYPLLLENLLKATPSELPIDTEGEHAPERADGLRGGRRHTLTTTTTTTTNRLASDQASRCVGGSRSQRHHLHHRHRNNQSISNENEGNYEEEEEEEEDIDEVEEDDDDGEDDEELNGGLGDQVDTDCLASRGDAKIDDEHDVERILLTRHEAAEEARRNSRRIMAISLAEEREFIDRALQQSRRILVRVNDSIKVAIARNRLKEIWKRTDKYPDVPLSDVDISKQQVIHEGSLTLRLSKRSFDVHVLLLNDYIIILTREGQDKYRLKFFTPEGKLPSFQSSVAAAAAANSSSTLGPVGNILSLSGTNPAAGSTGGGGSGGGGAIGGTSASGSSSLMGVGANNMSNINNLIGPYQTVYSPIFVIDEHLTTRDAATDENGFYLLCKRKDDCRIYEFASSSPGERLEWRDKIQTAIERQMNRKIRRLSCASALAKSSSEMSANEVVADDATDGRGAEAGLSNEQRENSRLDPEGIRSHDKSRGEQQNDGSSRSRPSTPSCEPTKIVGTISYVIDDGIVLPSKMESSRVLVDQAIQVNILDCSTMRGQMIVTRMTN